MKKTFFLILIALLLTNAAFASECIDWPKTMAQYDIEHAPGGRKTIVMQPFENFTRVTGDEWLMNGIPYLLAEYLNTSYSINAIFGITAQYSPASVSPEYAIGGMFQHVGNDLRVFVKLMQKTELVKQVQLDIPYPQNRQFFDKIGGAALELMKDIGPAYDKDKFKAVSAQTPVLPAYENYIRGVLAYSSFDPDQMDIARTWFEESKKADINFMKAYEGMLNIWTFLGLYNKQNKLAFAPFYEKAQRELSDMRRFSKRPPLPDRPKKYMIKMKDEVPELTNRFLLGHASFIAGLDASGQQRWLEAAKYFEDSVVQVPEDAITWYQLSKMRDRTGNKHAASKARAKAFEINKCLQ